MHWKETGISVETDLTIIQRVERVTVDETEFTRKKNVERERLNIERGRNCGGAEKQKNVDHSLGEQWVSALTGINSDLISKGARGWR